MARDATLPTSYDTPTLTQLRAALATIEKIQPTMSSDSLWWEIGRLQGQIKLAIIDAEIDAGRQAVR